MVIVQFCLASCDNSHKVLLCNGQVLEQLCVLHLFEQSAKNHRNTILPKSGLISTSFTGVCTTGSSK
jgi:hypothetical protein